MLFTVLCNFVRVVTYTTLAPKQTRTTAQSAYKTTTQPPTQSTTQPPTQATNQSTTLFSSLGSWLGGATNRRSDAQQQRADNTEHAARHAVPHAEGRPGRADDARHAQHHFGSHAACGSHCAVPGATPLVCDKLNINSEDAPESRLRGAKRKNLMCADLKNLIYTFSVLSKILLCIPTPKNDYETVVLYLRRRWKRVRDERANWLALTHPLRTKASAMKPNERNSTLSSFIFLFTI